MQEEEIAMRIGPSDPDEVVDFQVVLRQPGRAELDAFLVRVADPASPEYHRYLSPEAFGERFGLPEADIESVAAWLEMAGVEVIRGDTGRTFLTARARVSDVNSLFSIELVDHLDAELGRYHVPDTEPQVPAALQDSVLGIAGLDTSPRVRPMYGPPVFADVPLEGLLPRAGALAYDYAPLHDEGFTGEGQTVAIVSFDTFLDSDVAAFDAAVGITGPPVERRPVPEDFVPVLGEGSVEVNLDIDVIRAIAPAAQIIDYEVANSSTGFADVFAAILDDGRADIVSVSWGVCEVDASAIARVLIDLEMERAFAQGVSIFASSGDTGVFSCAHRRDDDDERVSGVYPSTSPQVISVGGTFLWVREDGTYLREAAWEEAFSKVATGGGTSGAYDRPDWQVGPGVDVSSGALRQTPDVAGPADGESGYVMVHTPIGATEPVRGTASGTSAAAPFWAATMILVRQLAEEEGVAPLGTLAPTLYELAAQQADPPLFHDVVLGGNLRDDAGPGWDAATGLGSPDVTVLARAMIELLRSR
jgi:kumamolisin